ncbi:MAG: ribonuclease D [Acidobacteria bacterium]|nr:ribonuclease D [Acidobacteriota bacterium]
MVASSNRLEAMIDQLIEQPRYALDTEFHREKTYFPKLALMQIAWPGHLVLIDPLSVDVAPLGRLMTSESLCVMHAAVQDIEVLCHVTGQHPMRIFDTQIAAGFMGLSAPSLATLHERLLGVNLAKGDRMTDWLERPLRQSQLDYAAADVARLLEITDLILAEIDSLGRRTWAEDESALLLAKGCALREPLDAWQRVKDLRRLNGPALATAQAIAAWREERAAKIDVPVRRVMSDIAIASLAQLRPQTEAEMSRARGFDPRSLKASVRTQLCELIVAAQNSDPREKPEPAPKLDELRPAAGLLAAWLSQRARELSLDPALLGTRSDIERLLAGQESSRLAHGWRHDLVGEPIETLVSGKAAIAFDGGALSLEKRSFESI